MKLLQLLEYGPGVYKQLIGTTQQPGKWRKETKDTVPDDVFKAAIDKFDRIKSGIKQKLLDTPPKIKLPDKFYAKQNLKPGEKSQKPLDPMNILDYTWKDIEHVFDAYGEKAEKISKDFSTIQDAHLVDVKGVNKIYSGNSLYVYEGSNKESCIKLNYAYKYKGIDNKIYSYNFCIGHKETASNRYYRYRFGGDLGNGALYRTFYYVVDSTQLPELQVINNEKPRFKNKYHFFIIHVFENGKFGVTDSINEFGTGHELDGGGKGVSWEDIGNFMLKYGGQSGQQAWNKIRNLSDIFKYIPPNEEEEVENASSNGKFNLESFIKASYEVKNAYINKRAGDSSFFTKDMFEICTTEQKNLAINSGFVPSFNDLKNKDGEIIQSLIRLYAKNKFRRNITAYEANEDVKSLLPLPFLLFLDDNSKQKYFELFNKQGITFEYTLKYFGENAAKQYVNNQVKYFKYIPKNAINFITDSKQRILYNIFHKLYKNWTYNPHTSVSEKVLETFTEMPQAAIIPKPFIYDDWKELKLEERQILLEITKKYGNKTDPNYEFLKYAIPYIIKKNNVDLILLPLSNSTDNEYFDWVLTDINANLIKKVNGEETEINSENIQFGYTQDILNSNKILNLKEVKLIFINDKKLKENKYKLSNYIVI